MLLWVEVRSPLYNFCQYDKAGQLKKRLPNKNINQVWLLMKIMNKAGTELIFFILKESLKMSFI